MKRKGILAVLLSASLALCQTKMDINNQTKGQLNENRIASSGYGNCSVLTNGMSPLSNASTAGFEEFGGSTYWNTDISSSPVDPNSGAIISFIIAHATDISAQCGGTVCLHPDFGQASGIPFSIVDGAVTPNAPFSVTLFPDESDQPTGIPLPSFAPIEGLPQDCIDPNNPYGDYHAIFIDRNTCWLYEMYQAVRCNGAWTASNTAVWDLQNINSRPYTWTSVDAAGLPVFPGLLRYDEVGLGHVDHAIRATMDMTGHAFVLPATHFAGIDGSLGSSISPIPLGMRLRLKASVDVTGFSTLNQVILNAMKKYGVIVADNGKSLFITGDVDGRWNDTDLHDLQNIPITDFEVIQMPPWYLVFSHGAQITMSGLTHATFLNGQTLTILDTGNDWSSFTANFTHASYSNTADTGNATMSAVPGNWGSIANGPIIAPVTSVSVNGSNVVTVTLQNNAGSNVPTGPNPTISSFTASSSSVSANTPVTLSWSVSNSSYVYLQQSPAGTNPEVGVTRATSQVVHPAVTTTYTLVSTNQYGRSTSNVTITVH